MALDFVAGCLGGCAGIIVGHPLDTVKVCLQTQNSRNPQYKGTIHCIKGLLAKDGVRGIFRGVSSPLAGVAAINAVVFGVYGNTQRHLSEPNALSSCFMAGAVAGLFQSVLASPMELAKTRVQISGSSEGPLQCLKDIYKTKGIPGIFKGLTITIAREIPAFGTYFVSYEYLTRTEDDRPVSTSTILFAGGFAGVISWIVSYPIDVIKSRIQIDGTNGSHAYKNSYDCLKKSIQSEGHGFLFRGMTPALVRAFPVNAVCFAVVSWTMRLFDGKIFAENVPQDRPIWERYSDVVYNMHSPESVLA